MTTALLLVDIQNDYFPGGAMALEGMDEAAARACELLHGFRDRGLPLVHVQHLSARPAAGFFLPGTPGVEISDAVAPAEGETVVRKHFPNAFRDTGLADVLAQAGAERLVICGAMSHMCIDATARAAFDQGFACTVAGDACATRDLAFEDRTVAAADVHGAFMAALGAVYARVVPAGEALAALSG